MLSMKAKYALRAVMVMAKSEKKLMQTRTIATEANVPPKFLEAIMADLKNQGIVISKRGMLGGYRLAKSADDITIGDVIRVIDGPLAPIRCASVTSFAPCDECVDYETCRIRHVMKDVRLAISNVLDQRSIRDMLALPGSKADSLLDD